MIPEEFTCAICHEVYEKGRPDKEAMAEAVENFGASVHTNGVIICDDCHQRFMSWYRRQG